MKPKLIIFDLDGTLLNTLEDLADSGNYILSKYGFNQHSLDDYRYFVGNGIYKLVERILPENKREKTFVEEVRSEFMSYYDQHKADKTAPYQGIIELLEELQQRGIQMAIASNKAQEAMDPLVEFYFPTVTFAAVFGQRTGIPTKPNPDIVFDILNKTNISKSDTLYVGDTAVDMQTAKSAGVKSVGVLWGFRPKEELVQAQAELIIEKPEELLKYC
ncbi:MAG: HAD family hydrolase [Bacteroidales bacterium]|nr:HAD family hydrolase [Bacteroidales bacterium]